MREEEEHYADRMHGMEDEEEEKKKFSIHDLNESLYFAMKRFNSNIQF